MAGRALELITEAEAFEIATPELCFRAVRDALLAAAGGQAWNNPVVIAQGLRGGESFSLKSGASRAERLVGAKLGSYWPSATDHGASRHSSVVVLLDPDTGRAATVVEAGPMNGRRTAAADAVAVDLLARPDCGTLSVIGAGAQARYEVEALMRVRSFRRVLVASRSAVAADGLASHLAARGVEAAVVDVRQACEAADVLVTATSSRAPLFEADWIAPGAHISAMGADQAGKQELPPALLTRARLFADLAEQSLSVGEFQWVREQVAGGGIEVANLGDALAGARQGRNDPDQITVFDSSGLALQDLYVAAAVRGVWRARRAAE